MRILSCEFDSDTACVELRYADGTMIFIDCTAVENEFADNYVSEVRAGLVDLQCPSGIRQSDSER